MSSTSSTLSTSFGDAVISNGVVAGGVGTVELGAGFVKPLLAVCVAVLVASVVVVSIPCVTDRGGRVLTGSVCFLDDVVVDGVVFVVVILDVVVD